MTPHPISAGVVKSVRVPRSDVEAAKTVDVTRLARTENSRHFAVMGAAILEKLCRSGKLAVRSRRTTPYILDTAHGKVALSVMVSAIRGSIRDKHMIVPLTSLPTPPGVGQHVIVCAFVSKYERTRETNGGLNVKLVGWSTLEEVVRYTSATTRVQTPLNVAPVPVRELHPIQTLRHYLAPQAASVTTDERNNRKSEGEKQCVNPVSDAS